MKVSLTRQLNKVFMAKNSGKLIIGVKEENIFELQDNIASIIFADST